MWFIERALAFDSCQGDAAHKVALQEKKEDAQGEQRRFQREQGLVRLGMGSIREGSRGVMGQVDELPGAAGGNGGKNMVVTVGKRGTI